MHSRIFSDEFRFIGNRQTDKQTDNNDSLVAHFYYGKAGDHHGERMITLTHSVAEEELTKTFFCYLRADNNCEKKC